MIINVITVQIINNSIIYKYNHLKGTSTALAEQQLVIS